MAVAVALGIATPALACDLHGGDLFGLFGGHWGEGWPVHEPAQGEPGPPGSAEERIARLRADLIARTPGLATPAVPPAADAAAAKAEPQP